VTTLTIHNVSWVDSEKSRPASTRLSKRKNSSGYGRRGCRLRAWIRCRNDNGVSRMILPPRRHGAFAPDPPSLVIIAERTMHY
jgi:hypothetical protein